MWTNLWITFIYFWRYYPRVIVLSRGTSLWYPVWHFLQYDLGAFILGFPSTRIIWPILSIPIKTSSILSVYTIGVKSVLHIGHIRSILAYRRHIGYNCYMTGITCSICANENATQVTTSGNYCVACYGRYYENRKR